MVWSQGRFEKMIGGEGQLILGGDDERVKLVQEICQRLLAALEVDECVSAARWPRDSQRLSERIARFQERAKIQPSARASAGALMPFRPESSNPEKLLEERDWELFVVDLPKINAFVVRPAPGGISDD